MKKSTISSMLFLLFATEIYSGKLANFLPRSLSRSSRLANNDSDAESSFGGSQYSIAPSSVNYTPRQSILVRYLTSEYSGERSQELRKRLSIISAIPPIKNKKDVEEIGVICLQGYKGPTYLKMVDGEYCVQYMPAEYRAYTIDTRQGLFVCTERVRQLASIGKANDCISLKNADLNPLSIFFLCGAFEILHSEAEQKCKRRQGKIELQYGIYDSFGMGFAYPTSIKGRSAIIMSTAGSLEYEEGGIGGLYIIASSKVQQKNKGSKIIDKTLITVHNVDNKSKPRFLTSNEVIVSVLESLLATALNRTISLRYNDNRKYVDDYYTEILTKEQIEEFIKNLINFDVHLDIADMEEDIDVSSILYKAISKITESKKQSSESIAKFYDKFEEIFMPWKIQGAGQIYSKNQNMLDSIVEYYKKLLDSDQDIHNEPGFLEIKSFAPDIAKSIEDLYASNKVLNNEQKEQILKDLKSLFVVDSKLFLQFLNKGSNQRDEYQRLIDILIELIESNHMTQLSDVQQLIKEYQKQYGGEFYHSAAEFRKDEHINYHKESATEDEKQEIERTIMSRIINYAKDKLSRLFYKDTVDTLFSVLEGSAFSLSLQVEKYLIGSHAGSDDVARMEDLKDFLGTEVAPVLAQKLLDDMSSPADSSSKSYVKVPSTASVVKGDG